MPVEFIELSGDSKNKFQQWAEARGTPQQVVKRCRLVLLMAEGDRPVLRPAVAGDIICTVALSPTLQDRAVLGNILFIDTFLSFSLQVEANGRRPWQRTGHEIH